MYFYICTDRPPPHRFQRVNIILFVICFFFVTSLEKLIFLISVFDLLKHLFENRYCGELIKRLNTSGENASQLLFFFAVIYSQSKVWKNVLLQRTRCEFCLPIQYAVRSIASASHLQVIIICIYINIKWGRGVHAKTELAKIVLTPS